MFRKYLIINYSYYRMLLAYLNDRLAHGDPLHGDAPVIAPVSGYESARGRNCHGPFLQTRQISKTIRKTFRPRFSWRPYVLRAYFDTELLVAESKGRVAHDFRVFFMGHKGSIEVKYTTNKCVLPEILVREMRESFGRSEDLLDLDLAANRPARENRQDTGSNVAQGVMQDAAPEGLGGVAEVPGTRREQDGGQSQRAVPCDEIDRYLSSGWWFVAVLPDARVIVQKKAAV